MSRSATRKAAFSKYSNLPKAELRGLCREKAMTMPVYKHDCSECEFVATVRWHGQTIDVYRCEQGTMPTWVARFGNDGPDYTSLTENLVAITKDGLHPLWDLLKPFAEGYLMAASEEASELIMHDY